MTLRCCIANPAPVSFLMAASAAIWLANTPMTASLGFMLAFFRNGAVALRCATQSGSRAVRSEAAVMERYNTVLI